MRPVLVSLTPGGAVLARRLLRLWPAAIHHHRPRPFAPFLQAQFRRRHPLACIASSGLVVRVLAPVLGDKRRDPPVLVLDEAGRFVVPLLSGHQGGANAWAWETAFALDAQGVPCQAVITSQAPYLRPARVAGMGCARGTPLAVLRRHLQAALEAQGWSADALCALATLDRKHDEPGLRRLAAQLGLPLVTFDAARLEALRPRLVHPSPVVARAVGCHGVAEAAALAAAEGLAGAPARLVLPKRKHPQATVALAEATP